MMFIIFVITSVVAAMVLHEFGHVGASWMSRIRASEVGIGVGPTLFSFRIGSVQCIIRALPLASYVRLDRTELQRRRLSQQLFVHLAGIFANIIAATIMQGTIFGWINLLVAVSNLLPLYPHDGWKCGVVVMRSLLGRKSAFVEWTFTFSGGLLSLAVILAVARHLI